MNFLDERMLPRFWSLVIPEPNSGCWLWIGGVNQDGYGRWLPPRDSGLSRYTHRAAYQALVGAVGPGLDLDHLCRTRPCCNPAHLEAVTHHTNMMRGLGVGSMNAAKTHCDSGHEFSTENTRIHKNGMRVCKRCERIWQDAYRARRAQKGAA